MPVLAQKSNSVLADSDESVDSSNQESRVDIQWEELKKLYSLLPSNKLNGSVSKTLHQVIQSLQSNTIAEHLQESYSVFDLKKYKESAQKEFEKMGDVNRERMQNLVGLSSTEMQKVVLESIFLFDINPSESSDLTINEQVGFDGDNDPLYETHSFPVFQENALCGIEGAKRFLPDSLKTGSEDMPGIDLFLRKEYSSLSSAFGNSEQGEGRPPDIKAISTIGSLGGIGHKPDSDMDIQVIFDSGPQGDENWNDGDFFIVLIKKIYYMIHQYFFETVLPENEQEILKRQVEEEILEKNKDALREDEEFLISLIFPSTFQVELHHKVWERFLSLDANKQAAIIWKQICVVTRENPFFEVYIRHLRKFFSFIQVKSEEKVRYDWFPYSQKTFSVEKLWDWIVDYYREKYLSRFDIQQYLRRFAKLKGLNVNDLSPKLQQKAIFEHLLSINQRAPIIKSFLNDLMEKTSLASQQSISKILQALIEKFDPERKFLLTEFVGKLPSLNKDGFLKQMVELIDFHTESLSIEREAKCEIALKKKVTGVENYLVKKYPDTEIHFFVNILRNQRVGRHTPFLVSPEGSMAYDLMLNDLLLNPAVLLCGVTPIPFDVPHNVKALCRIGVLPEDEWTLTQGEGDQIQKFPLRQLPDWGGFTMTRQKFLEYALPIFYRESEKISHRNLPKALLNCWWIELLSCIEDDKQELTSLTKLLFNPELRYFLRNELSGKWVRSVKMMEKEYPQLIRDLWWIKFTEMLFRFEDKEVQEQIIFCFSQHIRMSDIIDFNNQGKAIWIGEDISWRIKALVSYYEYFFEKDESRIDQMRFSQGYDDIGNKIEKTLKLMFLKSMKIVEKKISMVGSTKALKLLMGYILKIGGDLIGPKVNQIAIYTLEQLHILNEKFVVIDERVIQKVKDNEDLNNIEKIQWQQYRKDQKNLKATVGKLVEYYEQYGLAPSPLTIENLIVSSRVRLAGDPLENVIFKYHFERNFKRKPHQVPLPISKSLSIPRKRINLTLDTKTQKWIFKSVLSRKDAIGQQSRYTDRSENEIEMFIAPLVEGIARSVISGYIGFSAHNRTSIEKPPTRSAGMVVTNPVTNQDLQIIATEIHEFFPDFSPRPRELLNNTHYIREVFIVCNVNRFNRISLVIRDNLGDFFVTGFDVSRIKAVVRPSQMKVDFNLSRFFIQFNTRECRQLFMKALTISNIPLLKEYPTKFKIWINTGNFNFQIGSKFHRIYLEGIINVLWDINLIGTLEFLNPIKLKHNFDFYGKEAIQNRAQNEQA